MKDIPAMGNSDYSISTQITGDSGEAFLEILNDSKRELVASRANIQRKPLQEIVATRQAISEIRRQTMASKSIELDGDIAYYSATLLQVCTKP